MKIRSLLLLSPMALALALPAYSYYQDQAGWETIFNGKNLSGWTPKIRGHKAGDNFADTFRVEDGVMKVSYDKYDGKFNERFGHLFYKHPFSHYRLRLDYRFTGEQAPGGPGWAWRNSGVMIHGQLVKSMELDQDFPVSAEVQLLGGPETGNRSTGNLCTPGTNVVMDGKLITQHCTNSRSDTFRGDQWVHLEIEVNGNGIVKHMINGVEVFSYEQIQFDPTDKYAKPLIKDGKLQIEGGTISLQSESHPVEFKNIQIKPIS